MNPQPMGTEPTVIVQTNRGPVDVDASIALIVDALNKGDVPTVASCSGHGHRPGCIALRDGRELFILRDFEEARRFEALFMFKANGEAVIERAALDRKAVARIIREHHRTHVRQPSYSNEPRRTFHQGDLDAADEIARRFHEAYERLAPSFGYETREESAKPWADVPEQNKQLMIAVCAEIIGAAERTSAPVAHAGDGHNHPPPEES